MSDILEFLNEFTVASVILRLVASALMGGLIGFERGLHGAAAGFRTHILVCIGASMTSLTSMYLSETLGYSGDIARLSAQVISGIGFLGAGTILIRNSSVITGLTTAAGMWATAAIGVAVGYGFFVGAFGATLICVFVIALSRLEKNHKNNLHIYIELTDITQTEWVLEQIKKIDTELSYDIIPAKSGHSGNLGIICALHNNASYTKLSEQLSESESIAMVVSSIGN